MATIILSSQAVPENAQLRQMVGALNIDGGAEGEIFTFALVDERFKIAQDDEGQSIIVVREGVSFDFEAGPRHYMVNVQATGSLGTPVDDASFQIDITDVNEAPTDIVVTADSIPDNADLGTVVATLQAEDPDEGQSFTYALVQDKAGTPLPDHELFEIVENEIVVKGQLTVGSHGLWIKVTDSGNPALSYVKQVTLTVIDGNEDPEVDFEMAEVVEGAAGGTVVGSLTVTDPDAGDRVEYSLIEVDGDIERPSTMFTIDANGNVVVLDGVKLLKKDGVDPTFIVKAFDGTKTIYRTFEVVLGENQEPVVTFDSVEDLPRTIAGGTPIGTITADDPENDAVSYTLVGDSKNLLRIDGTGRVFVLDGAELSYSKIEHRSFTVEWFDGINRHTETHYLEFANEAPVVTLTSQAILEGNPVSRVVGRVSAVDPEGDALNYKLVGDNASLFDLVKTSAGYDIVLRPDVVLDYESPEHQALTVDVQVSDGTPRDPETLAIDIADVDEVPGLTFSARAVNEGVKGGTIIGRLNALDPEGGSVDYQLSPASARYFDLVDNDDGSCNVVVRSGVTLDHESLNHRSFSVTISDGEHEISRTLVLNLLDIVDVVSGTQRKDTLKGQSGSDIISGLGGDDLLVGNDGNDTLHGGSGKDVLTGGNGQDVFVFDTKPSGKASVDKVTDFDVKDDTIWLENKVFTKLGRGTLDKPLQLKKDLFWTGKAAHDASDRIVYDKASGALYYDQDGTGHAAQVKIATLKRGLAVGDKDFFVI